MKHTVLHIFFHFLLSFSILGQTVVINELQNKNYRTIIDEDGDYEDWVEIINTGDQSIDLNGYGLTDDQTEPDQWIFPDMEIAPSEIILIFLSGKNRDNADSELHTNFSLSGSEELMLSSPDFSETDLIPPIFLLRDISYGIAADSELAYFGIPTPGAPNLTQDFSGICQPPSFSHPSGFYESNFNLSVTAAPGFEVIYSVDGSDPAEENIGIDQTYLYKNSYAFNPSQSPGPFLTETYTSMIYDGPIEIEDVSAEPDRLSQKSSTNDFNPNYFPDSPSFKGMVVKARSTAPGLLPSEVVSKVFFITPEGWSRYNLPVVSITMDEKDLSQHQGGIHTAGQTFDIWRQNNPDVFPPPIFQANYGRRGDLWERPAQMDFFDMENESIAFSAELGIRIHGASSRRWPRKSFRLYARGIYDTDEINYEFFPSHHTAIFERLILRNGGSDEWLANMRDALVHRIAAPMRAITVASKPYNVFINGEFYGVNNLRENIDDNYFKIRYGIEDDDLDLIEGADEVQSGNIDRYLEVYN
ncbi:MAG: CotH kinase family protein, partial [Cryomorphaceae bacterium]